MSCYNCKFRGSVPGSAHSSCQVLRNRFEDPNNPKVILLEMACAFGGTRLQLGDKEIIKIDPHGKNNGWAYWPLDFDPVWVSECQIYEEKK